MSTITGQKHEEMAYKYLVKHNLIPVARNFYSQTGEIDLIFLENHKNIQYLLFIEVKYRKSSFYGLAVETVNNRKQQKIYQTAEYFIYKNPKYKNIQCRFDIITIQNEKLEWLKNAF